MRLNEFERTARRNVAERHRVQEQQLDEIIPAIGAAAGALARKTAAAGKGAAKAAGKSIAGTAKSIARGANTVSKNLAKGAVSNNEPPETNDPNATVGTQTSDTATQTTQGTQGTQGTSGTSNSTGQSSDIKQGKTVKLPAGKSGLPKQFKVTRVQGDDVELENPLPKPGEPKRFVYNKNDVESNLK